MMGPWKGSTPKFRTVRPLTKSPWVPIIKKTTTLSSKTWPRFFVIGSSNDEALKKLSPFAIQKGLEGLAGEPKSVKKLRSGSLLIECATESHSKNLLKSKLLCNISINVTPHTTLNSSKGVVRLRDLEGVSEEEICENLSSQGVSSVRRNNELVPTNTLIKDLQYTYPSRFCESGLLAHSCCAVHSKPVTVLQMSKVWARTKYVSWKIVLDVVNLTMTAKHVKTKLHVPIVTGNTLRTRESAQGGKWKKRSNKWKLKGTFRLLRQEKL